MKKINTPVTLIGIVLMVISVLGVLFVGQLINPPGVQMAVAIVEIPPGTVITKDMVRIDTVQGNPKVAASHVQASELDQFIGAVAVEPIHQYSYLPKSALSKEGNPAAANRMALALSDPKLVAMVVPVSQVTAPDAIVEGDRVDLNFGTQSSRSSGQTLTTRPTEPAASFSSQSLGVYGAPTGIVGPTETAAPTETPEPLLMLPVAKTLVSQAKVLAVVREQNSTTTTDSTGKSVQVTTPGAMLALVVAVPREAQELLQFAIDNGNVRVSLLSAQVTGEATARQPTLGMTWNDLVSLMRMDRDAALSASTQQVMGPGAYAIESTRDAQTQTALATQTTSQTPGAPMAATQAPATSTKSVTATAMPAPSATPKK